MVKPAFLPDEGHVWLDADMQSFELRVFGHLINDPNINQLYKDNIATDFHQAVADLTGLPRNAAYSGQANAKTLNLSAVFNKGNGGIAETLGMPWTWGEFSDDDGEVVRYKKAGPEAMEVINKYHEMLPGVKNLAKKAAVVAGSRGYIYTKYGRRIRFPDKRFLYKASGMLIQSTSADLNKVALKLYDQILPEFGGYVILNTHDSYSVSLPADSWKPAWARMQEAIRDEFSWMNVPLLLELSGVGTNWWAALQDELGGKNW